MTTDAAAWARFGDVDVDVERSRGTARMLASLVGGLIGDLVRERADDLHDRRRVRRPVHERAALVREGREDRFPAVLHGDAPWCPPPFAAERLVHLLGGTVRHTHGLVSAETPVPTTELVPTTLRAPRTDDVEGPVTDRRHWVAVELDHPAGRTVLLAHRSDVAVLATVARWPFPG